MPVIGTVLPAGAIRVKVRALVPPTIVLIGENDLLMAGGATTVKVAEAVFPFPPLVELTWPLVLFLTPFVVPITLTLTVQELFVILSRP